MYRFDKSQGMLAYRVKGIRWRRVVGRKVKAKGWCAVFPRVNQKQFQRNNPIDAGFRIY